MSGFSCQVSGVGVRGLWGSVGLVVLLLGCVAPAAELDSTQVMERYEQMLQRRPRQGTTLERLYRMQVEALNVQAWLDTLVSRADADSANASDALLAGLALIEHGETDRALPYLDRASALAPDAVYPHLAKGRALNGSRQFDAAVEVLRKAAEMEGSSEDQIEILTLLGACQIRSGNPVAGIRTWDRILERAPDDPQLMEGLADILYEEDQPAAAARYYRALLEAPGISAYQRVLYTSKCAQLHARQGESEQALTLYDALLDQVGPEHWLFEEVVEKIEELYRGRGAYEELAAYYENRLSDRPADSDLLLRLAGVHRLRDDAEARKETLERALNHAPTRSDVRWALVEVLMGEQQWGEAKTHLERLVRESPERLAYRFALGRALIRTDDSVRGVSLFVRASDDPAVDVQAAQILFDEDLVEEGEALLVRAAERAPDIPEYAEQLADYYFQAGRVDAGLGALRGMVASGAATGLSWARLAESLAQRGYLDEAVTSARNAVTLAPESFEVGVGLVTLLNRSGRFAEALAEVERLHPLAPNEYFAGDLADRRIHLLRRTNGLEEAYLAHIAKDESEMTVEDRIVAARMAFALRQRDEALRWLERVVEAKDTPVATLETAERMFQELGETGRSHEILERMLVLAPERADTILRRVYDLFSRAGDLEAALRTANRWVDRSPARAEGHRLAAQAAHDMGRLEMALDSMRRAARVAPQDFSVRIQFARMLEYGDLAAEAIEMYWQALELAEDAADKLNLIEPLAELHLDQDRWPEFLDRLQRWQRTDDEDATASLALVMAHEHAGDFSLAERMLTSLSDRHSRDTAVLRRLVRMGEDEGDAGKAVRYQRRLVEHEPSAANYQRLGDLLLEAGDQAGALETWRMTRQASISTGRGASVEREFGWIDRLWETGFDDEARRALQALYASHGGGWRVALRVGAHLWEDDDLEAAFPVLRRVAEWPPEGENAATTPITADPREFPDEYETLQSLSLSRYLIDQPVRRALQTGFGGQGPTNLAQARALAIAYLATLKGEIGAFDAWWDALTTGTFDQRRLALQIAVALGRSDTTRAMARAMLEEFPDDPFARYVLMVPSRAEVQTGLDEAFFDCVREQLDWLRVNRPDHDWFYDWHYMELLVRHNDPDAVRDFAEKLDRRAHLDPLLLALVTSQIELSRLYELFDRNVDQAVRFYRDNGEPAMADQLLNTLGRMAASAADEGRGELGLRMLNHYLDAGGSGAGNAGTATSPPFWLSLKTENLGTSFPLPTRWWSSLHIGTLKRMHQVMVGTGKEDVLLQLMANRVDAATGAGKVRPLLGMAFVQWWNGDVDSIDDVLASAIAADPEPDELRVLLAHFYAGAHRPREALETLNEIHSRYGARHRLIQGWILALALELGDSPVARTAARELMRMRLDPEDMLNLADRMATVGMTEDAERIQKRWERRRDQGLQRGGGPGPSGSLQRWAGRMTHYLQKEEFDKVQTMALQILRVLPGAPVQEQARFHKQALDTLRRIGRLESARVETEARFAAYPNRDGLLELLFSLYRATGRDEDAARLVQRHLGEEAESADVRLHFARMSASENDPESAAEQLEWLLRRRPDLIFGARADYWLISKAFTFSGGDERLVAAVKDIPAEQLAGRGTRNRTGRERIVGNVLQCSRDVLKEDHLPNEVALRLCEAIEPYVSARSLRTRYAPMLLELKAEALLSMGDVDLAFRNLATCVLADPVRERFGVEMASMPSPKPLHGVSWGQERVDGTIFRFLDVAAEAGKMDDLAREVSAALANGQRDQAFLSALLQLRQGNLEGFLAIREVAMNTVAEPAGRQSAGQSLLQQRTLLGQALRDVERPDLAVDVFLYALDHLRNGRSNTIHDTLIRYVVDSCMEANQRDRARDTLRDVLRVREENALRSATEAARLNQNRLMLMRQFHELGFYEDAVGIGLALSEPPASASGGSPRNVAAYRYYRERATKLMEQVRMDGSAELRESGRLAQAIRDAEAEIEATPGQSAGWRKLLWLNQLGQNTQAVVRVRQRIMQQFPDDTAWCYPLARSAMNGGAHQEATAHFTHLLQQQPAILFRRHNAYREMFHSFDQSDQLTALDQAVEGMDFARLVQDPQLNRNQRNVVVQQVTQFAHYAIRAPILRPALGLSLAGGLRSALEHRPAFKSSIGVLDAALVEAVRAVDWSGRDKFEALVELMVDSDTRGKLGMDATKSVFPLAWTVDMNWEDRVDKGVLPLLLSYGGSSAQLDRLERACAHSADRNDFAYLRWLVHLAQRSPMPANQVSEAVACATELPAGAGERAYLLLLLADGLREVGQGEEAEDVLLRALEICRNRGLVDAWLVLRKEWVRQVRDAGRDREALDLLMDGNPPRTHTLGAKQRRQLQARIDRDTAEKLMEMGRLAEAWEVGRRALSRLVLMESGAQVADLESLLEQIQKEYLPKLAEKGELNALILAVRDQPTGGVDSVEMLAQVYRMYLAGNDLSNAERILEQIVALRPGDGQTRLAVAELLAAEGRTADAVEQYLAAQRLVPGLPLQNRESASRCAETFQAEEKLPVLAQGFADTGLSGLVRGMWAGQGQVDGVAQSLVAMARRSLEASAPAPETALLFLAPLEEDLRGLVSIRQWRRAMYETKLEALRLLDRPDEVADVLTQLVTPSAVLTILGIPNRIGAPIPLDRLITTGENGVGGLLIEFLDVLEASGTLQDVARACNECPPDRRDAVPPLLAVCASLRCGEPGAWEHVAEVQRRIRQTPNHQRVASGCDRLLAAEAERLGMVDEAVQLLAGSSLRAAQGGHYADENRMVLAHADLLLRAGREEDAAQLLQSYEPTRVLGKANPESARTHRTAFYRDAARRLLAGGHVLEGLDRVHQALAQEPDRRENVSMRDAILRTTFEELAREGRLDPVIHALDRRLSQADATGMDWETRFWCARAADDQAGMAHARTQALAASDHPYRAAMVFAQLSLEANAVDDAVNLLLEVWDATPAAWFESTRTAQRISEAFSRAGRVDELMACLARVPLRDLMARRPHLKVPVVLSMGSRLRRADLKAYEASLGVANWIRNAAQDTPQARRYFLAAERIAEAALAQVDHEDLAFREYARRLCSRSWRQSRGQESGSLEVFWGEEWNWSGSSLDCMPARWVALAERLGRTAELLEEVNALEHPGPGDQLLAHALQLRADVGSGPTLSRSEVAGFAGSLATSEYPDLDLRCLAWVASEWNRAGMAAEAIELLQSIRTQALERGRADPQPLVTPLTRVLTGLLDEEGRRSEAVEMLRNCPTLNGPDETLGYLLASAQALHELGATEHAHRQAQRILDTSQGQNYRYFHEQAQKLIDGWAQPGRENPDLNTGPGTAYVPESSGLVGGR